MLVAFRQRSCLHAAPLATRPVLPVRPLKLTCCHLIAGGQGYPAGGGQEGAKAPRIRLHLLLLLPVLGASGEEQPPQGQGLIRSRPFPLPQLAELLQAVAPGAPRQVQVQCCAGDAVAGRAATGRQSAQASLARQRQIPTSPHPLPLPFPCCSHPRAAEASATVNQAYDTLSNAIKKASQRRALLPAQPVHVCRFVAAMLLQLPGTWRPPPGEPASGSQRRPSLPPRRGAAGV